MEELYINQVQFVGKIGKAAEEFKGGMWFTLMVGRSGHKGYVSVLCYNKYLFEYFKRYVHQGNLNKRVYVQGEILFPAEASKAILMKLTDIKAIDELIDADAVIDFSED